jgi:acetyl esterase/lipase/ketosteroid isomerase-like protein
VSIEIARLLGALLIVAAASAHAQPPAQESEEARLRRMAEIVNRPVVYKVPGMDQVKVRKDLVYKETADANVRMDVYTPPGLTAGEKRPAVVFIHGGAATAYRPKEWGIYQSWGRLVAASGMVGVTFTHRLGFPKTAILDGASDVADAIAYVRAHAADLGVDGDRLCLAAYSAGGPMLSPFLGDPRPYVRCLVAFYTIMDIRQSEPHRQSETAETLEKFSPIVQIAKAPARVPPLFLARGGQDQIPGLLDTLDRFVAEALKQNIPLTLANHPQGVHGFDNQNDDERSREILAQAVEFMKGHLGLNTAPPSREEALIELERRRSQAIWVTDLKTLDGIYADDFRGLLANGRFVNKAELFEVFKTQDPALRFTIEELDARVLGDTAVTHGKFTGRTPQGEIVILSKFTHVLLWRDGRWQVVEGANTPLPRG